MIYNQIARQLEKNLGNLGEINARLASGKRINKPSDDPIGLVRALDYRLSIGSNNQYERNIEEAGAQLGFVDTVLTSLSDAVVEAKKAAVTGASGVLDSVTRTALARHTLQLRDSFLSLGNSTFRGRFIFSGFRTDIPAFDAVAFAYQGDNGVINAPIDRAAVMPVNLSGSDVFGYVLSAPDVIQISGGRYVHYTPGGGTAVNVEIRDTDDTTVLDTFSFSNVIQMMDLLSQAVNANDVLRIESLIKPFDLVHQRVISAQAEVGTRLGSLNGQTERLGSSTLILSNLLSETEDADIAQTAVELNKAETALKALLKSSADILSTSLMDFLR